MRELLWAAHAKRRDQWDHTCAMIATICNNAFGRKGRKVDPVKIHPLRKRRRKRRQMTTAETTSMLDNWVGL